MSVLYSFTGTPDGYFPYGPVVLDKSGKIFGTTADGGTAGYGTVFALTTKQKTYSEAVIHNFINTDGAVPLAIQTVDANSTLLVTAEVGGTYGDGTAVELTKAGKERTVVSFNDAVGGAYPEAAGLLVGPGSTVYTTTYTGGKYGAGAVVSLGGAAPIDVYDFTGGSDGGNPQSALAADSAGALYGTTYSGGSAGLGTVFKVVPAAKGARETVLWSFKGGSDGANPWAGVVLDPAGNLYGTTLNGGSAGDGVVYSVASGGKHESILHTFSGPPDGATPYAGLTIDGTLLYGTTFYGGGGTLCAKNCGTIFVISTTGANYAIVHNFTAIDGSNPSFGSIVLQGRALYGATVTGGSAGYGEVFRYTL